MYSGIVFKLKVQGKALEKLWTLFQDSGLRKHFVILMRD